ncbi:class II aldolase/adducin family protein [Saliphagus sp. GCM10025334]
MDWFIVEVMEVNQMKEDLARANRILSNEEILDGFGHVSARHPDGDKMLVSSYQSPGLVQVEDLIEMSLDGDVLTKGVDEIYSENVIHRAIYQSRDDVGAVIHCHAPPLIPFTVTDAEIKPVTHQASPFHEGVPTFDDYDDERGRMVVTEAEGARMADVLGDKQAQLLEGHGINIVGKNVREATVLAMHLVQNAEHQLAAEGLGDPRYFTEPKETLEATANDTVMKPRTIGRAWGYLVHRLGEEE